MSQAAVPSWRGVAGEEVEEVSANLAGIFRSRVRRLLAILFRPYRKPLLEAAGLIVLKTAATLSIPFLVGIAIDQGIRPGGPANLRTLLALVAVLACTMSIAALANRAFLVLSGRIGQDVLYDLRLRLFGHIQSLSISFFEHYTSGRIIARLTSDIDALQELLATGLSSVVTAILSVVAIAVILLRLDLRLGLADAGRISADRAPDAVVPLPVGPLLPRRADRDRPRHRPLHGVARRDPGGADLPAGGAQPGDLRGRRRPLPRRQHLVEHAGRDLRARHLHPRSRHHGGGPRLRRPAGRAGQPDARRPDRLHPLPAPVLRADAGPEPVLHGLPVRLGSAREGLRRARRGPPSPRTRTAAGDRRTGRRARPGGDLLRIPGDTRSRGPDAAHPRRPGPRLGRPDRGRQVDPRSADRALLRPRPGPDPARRRRPAPAQLERAPPFGRDGHPGVLPLLRDGRREHRLRPPGKHRRRRSRRRPARSARTASSPPFPRATRPTSGGGASGSPPASGSWSPSPVRSWPIRGC